MKRLQDQPSVRSSANPGAYYSPRYDDRHRADPRPSRRARAMAEVGRATYERARSGDQDALEVIMQACGEAMEKQHAIAHQHAELTLAHQRLQHLHRIALEAAEPDPNEERSWIAGKDMRDARIQAIAVLHSAAFSAHEIAILLTIDRQMVLHHVQKIEESCK